MTRAEVWQAAARHVDVLSVNFDVDMVAALAMTLSGGLDPTDSLAAQHELTGQPLLISGFGLRAADSGLPNSFPPVYPTLATPADRAAAYDARVSGARGGPWMVGTHWFAWADQPAAGRCDGEDNNWGLDDEADDPCRVVVERMTAVNAR